MYKILACCWLGRVEIATVADRGRAEAIARNLATDPIVDGAIVETCDDPTAPSLVYIHNLISLPARPEVPPAA